MALNTFGWTPAEVTTDSAGNVISGVTLTVFTDVTKATQVTGLMDKDGVTPLANNVVVSDNKGRFGFKASDTYSLLYVYDGSTADPWPIAAHEALDQGMASHAAAVTAAQNAANSAAASAALVGAPADTIMATTVGNAASATRGALNAAYARPEGEAFADWTKRANGAPGAIDTGQTPTYSRNSNAGADFAIVGGALTNVANTAAVAASYAETQLSHNVTRVGGEFTFSAAGTTDNGNADLIVWKTKLTATYPTIPDSPCHLQISNVGWRYGVFNSGTLTDIKTGTFASPLTADGVTIQRAEVVLIGDTATVFLPDGTVQTVKDSRIKDNAGPFLCWEIYQNNSATDHKPAWLRSWGDSAPVRDAALLNLAKVVKPVDATNVESGAGAWARAGLRNTASGSYTATTGGTDNLANQSYAQAHGLQAKTPAYGARTHAAGMFSSQGDAQYSDLVFRQSTTTATVTKMGTNGASSVSGAVPVAGYQAQAVEALVVARRNDNLTDMAAYKVTFMVARDGTANVALYGTPTVTAIYENQAAWDVAPVVDTATQTWTLQVTGEAAKTIHWVAAARVVSVI